MLYEKYQSVMSGISSAIKFIKRFKILILSLTATATACTSAGMAASGIVYDVVECPASIVYGEDLSYEANAVFEDFYYEYAKVNSSEWTREEPHFIGDYQVRAVSTRTFGAPSYGDVHTFTINPKEVSVYVDQEKIEYGEMPTVAADIAFGDVISCSKITYRDLENKEVSKVTPVASAIKVTNEKGEDVTECYTFVPVEKDIKFALRQVDISILGGEIVYDGAPYQSDEYEITKGSLAFEDTLSLSFDKSITNVGSEQNTAKISVLNKDGIDVTHQYYILIECGDLIVNKRPITLTTKSDTFMYNGEDNTAYDCEEKIEEDVSLGLAKGHKLVRNEDVPVAIKDVGTIENTLEYFIHDEDGNDVTDNYEITYEYGTLEVTPRPIKILTGSQTWVYDGTAHDYDAFDYAEDTAEELVAGHTFKAITENLPSVKYVLENAAETENIFEIGVFDGETPVTDNYKITYAYGKIAITPLAIEFKVTDAEKEYDGTALTGSEYTTAPSLIAGDNATVQFTGSMLNVGETDCEITVDKIENEEQDVTLCYTISWVKGTLTVTPREIVVTTCSEDFTYDGAYHFNIKDTKADDLVAGHTLKVVEYAKIQDVIRSLNDTTVIEGIENAQTFKILSNEGTESEADETSNYKIVEVKKGTLRILPREIVVTTPTAEFLYDAESHSKTDGASADDILAEHKVVYNETYGKIELTNVVRENGKVIGVDNEFVVRVVSNDESLDYTNNYDITYTYGTLKILPLEVKIQTGSKTWTYDGQTHTHNEFDYAEDTKHEKLAEHTFKIITENLPSVQYVLGEEAKTENIFEIGVFDGETPVTNNYEITYVYGEIAITPLAIEFKVTDAEKEYDGTALTGSEYTNTPNLIAGEKATVTFIGSITDVGVADCELTVDKIENGEQDVTLCYAITCKKGTLTITPREIVVTTGSEEWTYDGETHSFVEMSADRLLSEHTLHVKDKYTTITDVGEKDNVFEVIVKNGEEDVTGNYHIVEYIYGTLTVLPRPIVLAAESAKKIYDDTPLTATGFLVLINEESLGLVEGHSIVNMPKAVGSQTDVGTSDNIITVDLSSLIVRNEKEEVVTGNYTFIRMEKGTLTVEPRPITVQTGSKTWVYDDTPHSYTEATKGLDDPNNLFDGLVAGHYIHITEYVEICDVGKTENTQKVIIKKGDRDVSSNYKIAYDYGTLQITPRPITVQTGSKTWVYDDEWHSYTEATKGLDDPNNLFDGLVAGHYIHITEYVEICDVGKTKNTQKVIIKKGERDVSNNYKIAYDYGTLEITPRPIIIQTGSKTWVYDDEWHSYTDETKIVEKNEKDYGLVSGHELIITDEAAIRDVGEIKNEPTVLIKRNKTDVTKNYKIIFESGTLVVTPRPITLQTGSQSWIYDDEWHSYTDETKIVEKNEENYGLVSTHKYSITDYATIRDAGSMDNTNTVKIVSNDNRDVTKNYKITYDLGVLKVTPRKLTFETGSGEWNYDGLEHYNIEDTVLLENDTDEAYGLLQGHTYELIDYAKIKEAGSIPNEHTFEITASDGRNVTGNYEITLEKGTLTVHPRKLTIITGGGEKPYDGTALTNSSYTYLEEDLAPEDKLQRLTVVCNGSQTEIGSSLNTVDETKTIVRIVDKNGVDVTEYYKIVFEYGELTVTKRSIIIQTNSKTKPYDGTPLTDNGYTMSGDGLLATHQFVEEMFANGSQTEIGESDNTFNKTAEEILINDENENDVGKYYEIKIVYGKLTVTKRSIVIKTNSNEKIYDGTPLTDSGYKVGGAGLLATHKFANELLADGSQTEIGQSDNTLNIEAQEIRIVDENGNDVGDYYEDIKVVFGKLEVLEDDGEDDDGDVGFVPVGGLIDLSGSLSGKNNSMGGEGDGMPVFSFTVEQDGKVYFRVKSYGDYTYDSWAEAKAYNVSGLSVNPLYFASLALAEAGYDISTITIKDLCGGAYWMLPYFAAAGSDDSVNDVLIENANWDEYTLSMYVYEYMINDGVTLEGTAYESLEKAYREFVYANYTALPSSTKAAMESVIRNAGLDKDSEKIIFDVANYVRAYLPYDIKTPNYEGDYAIYFFETAETAVCRHYATAAVALYRTLGIPARYVIGYAANGSAGMENVVKAGSAEHAWVEVYIDGLGWIPLEVTGGGEGGMGGGPVVVGGGGSGGGSGGGGSSEEKLTLTLKPLNVSAKYDPANPTLYAKNELDPAFIQSYLDKGYTYEVVVIGSQTGVGTSASYVEEGSFKLFDKYGTDVTDQCELTYLPGSVAIYDNFYVEIYPMSYPYDGKEHRYVDFESYGYKWYKIYCPEGYEISFDASKLGRTEVGMMDIEEFYNMPITVKYNGQVLTENIPNIIFIGRGLVIIPPKIVISTGSATAKYVDDIVLTNAEVKCTKGALAKGHTVHAKAIGKLTEVGEIQNAIGPVTILDENGNDVTKNYEIKVELGILKIVEDT